VLFLVISLRLDRLAEIKKKVGDGIPYCSYEMNAASVDRVQDVSVYDCIESIDAIDA